MKGISVDGRGSFAVLLRAHRVAMNVTQEELATRSGLSAQAISLLERGARSPRADTMERLAGALELRGAERETFLAAGRGAPPPVAERRVRRRRGVAVAAVLLAALVAASIGWWRLQPTATNGPSVRIGARAVDWLAADQEIGPLRTQRIYYGPLPPSFRGTEESNLPAGAEPIVSYQVATTNVAAYVASVTRPLILIFYHSAESQLKAAPFVAEFERQADLIRSAGNRDVSVAMTAEIGVYQPNVNADAVRCGYIPPPASVDYYLADVYDPYLRGLAYTNRGAFVAWQRCTAGLRRPLGLSEYALGLGRDGSASCQPESERTSVLRSDLAYLRAARPSLRIIEYQWKMTPKPSCANSWQFPAGSSTADLWRATAEHWPRAI